MQSDCRNNSSTTTSVVKRGDVVRNLVVHAIVDEMAGVSPDKHPVTDWVKRTAGHIVVLTYNGESAKTLQDAIDPVISSWNSYATYHVESGAGFMLLARKPVYQIVERVSSLETTAGTYATFVCKGSRELSRDIAVAVMLTKQGASSEDAMAFLLSTKQEMQKHSWDYILAWLPGESTHYSRLFAFPHAKILMNFFRDDTQEEAPQKKEEEEPPLSADVMRYLIHSDGLPDKTVKVIPSYLVVNRNIPCVLQPVSEPRTLSDKEEMYKEYLLPLRNIPCFTNERNQCEEGRACEAPQESNRPDGPFITPEALMVKQTKHCDRFDFTCGIQSAFFVHYKKHRKAKKSNRFPRPQLRQTYQSS